MVNVFRFMSCVANYRYLDTIHVFRCFTATCFDPRFFMYASRKILNVFFMMFYCICFKCWLYNVISGLIFRFNTPFF